MGIGDGERCLKVDENIKVGRQEECGYETCDGSRGMRKADGVREGIIKKFGVEGRQLMTELKVNGIDGGGDEGEH